MLSHPLSAEAELQLIGPQHAEPLFGLIDQNRAHLRQWLAWVDDIQSVDDERQFVQRSADRLASNGAFHCAIMHRGVLAGTIGLHDIDHANRKAEIGYFLAVEYQGKGLMTLACRAVTEHLFSDLKLHRAIIFCGTENRRSRAIPERLGFKLEGIHRDAEWIRDHFVDLACYAKLATHA
ncbi:MAG TPA: GNAT family protein [Tepidisphaeraceae bacterium]|jgi:ribosomal-protein-serine acetyltransferase